MFNIGLIELIIIIFVSLIVVKPEDIPKISKYFGLFYRKVNRYIFNFKYDLSNFDLTDENEHHELNETKQKKSTKKTIKKNRKSGQ
ncbi:hypothetical protein OA848_01880 [Rickettsiales bacterium]|nr:hypothetical protein [Rickettsiales bacterium]